MALTRISNDTLQDTAVSTSKLQDLSVSTSKLQDAAVSTLKLQDLAVSSGKLQDATITQAKLGAEFTEVITYNQGTGFPSVLDFSAADQWVMDEMASYLTLNITNAQPGMVKLLSIYPWQGVLTWDASITVKVLNGTFDDLFNWNYIQIICQSANTYLITISQEQV